MHENREISSTPWSDDQGGSANINRTADMHVVEQSGEDSYLETRPVSSGSQALRYDGRCSGMCEYVRLGRWDSREIVGSVNDVDKCLVAE